KPTIVLNSVHEITTEILAKNGIKGLILDLDNTLTTHNNPKPADGVLDWIEKMKSSGIKLMIVSNNNHNRVKPFAEVLQLEFESNGAKPLPLGFHRAAERMGIPLISIAAVGDQLFTDILGANISKIKSIFVFPFEPEKGILFAAKRFLEKPFLPKRS
ncbi:MAG: YqeG family HAD IIIA-type phosphatase, partial [Oscillospiraceae bacterium]